MINAYAIMKTVSTWSIWITRTDHSAFVTKQERKHELMFGHFIDAELSPHWLLIVICPGSSLLFTMTQQVKRNRKTHECIGSDIWYVEKPPIVMIQINTSFLFFEGNKQLHWLQCQCLQLKRSETSLPPGDLEMEAWQKAEQKWKPFHTNTKDWRLHKNRHQFRLPSAPCLWQPHTLIAYSAGSLNSAEYKK